MMSAFCCSNGFVYTSVALNLWNMMRKVGEVCEAFSPLEGDVCGLASFCRTLYNLVIALRVVRSCFLWRASVVAQACGARRREIAGASLVSNGAKTTSAMAETTVLKVAMSCQGCVGAVKRAIGKLDGVESYDIDIKEQKVTVVGNLKPEVVLDRISKTGKATSFWSDEPAAKTDSPPAEAVAVL